MFTRLLSIPVTLFLCVIYLISVSMYTCLSSIGSTTALVFEYHGAYADDFCKSYESYTHALFQGGHCVVLALFHDISRLFPEIKKLTIETLSCGITRVDIDLYAPLICINDSHLILENNNIVEKSSYDASLVSLLPHVCMKNIPQEISNEMRIALDKSVAHNIFDYFAVTIVKDHEWYLQDKADTRMVLCCSTDTLPYGALAVSYDAIKRSLREMDKNAHTHWMADVRFDKHIVVKKAQGGHNGTWL